MDEHGFPLVNRNGLMKINPCEVPAGKKLSKTQRRFIQFQRKVCDLWNSQKYDDVLFCVLQTKTSHIIRTQATDRLKTWIYQITIKSYLMEQRHDDAFDFIGNLLLNPKHSKFLQAHILSMQGEIFLDRFYNDTEAAVECHKRASEILPKDPDILYALANAYFFNNDFTSASKILESAKSLRSPNADQQFKRIICYQKLGNEKKANRLIKRFLKSDVDRNDQRDPRNLMPEFANGGEEEDSFMYGIMKNVMKVMSKTWDEDACDIMAYETNQCFDNDRNLDTQKIHAFFESTDQQYKQRSREANLPMYECANPTCKDWKKDRLSTFCDTVNLPECSATSDASKESWTCLKICKGCKGVYYCGRECQKKHWNTHKKSCGGRSAQSSSERFLKNMEKNKT